MKCPNFHDIGASEYLVENTRQGAPFRRIFRINSPGKFGKNDRGRDRRAYPAHERCTPDSQGAPERRDGRAGAAVADAGGGPGRGYAEGQEAEDVDGSSSEIPLGVQAYDGIYVLFIIPQIYELNNR